jgi:uncharacterized protein YjbJ (UPF0337 family)
MVDKDRIQGSAEQAKDKVKEVVGKVTGDSKLEGEGKALISSRAKCRTRQVRGCPNAQVSNAPPGLSFRVQRSVQKLLTAVGLGLAPRISDLC